MKAISLWQPWATLVMCGAKQIETRSWGTSHRGPLLIHAGLKCTRELIELCHEEPFRTALRAAGIERWQQLPLGAVLGTVELHDVRQMHFAGAFVVDPQFEPMWQPPAEPERSFGRYEAGRFAWMLRQPIRFTTPRPARGRQQLFDIPPEELGLR